jgi:hypothetical protein
MGVVEVELTGEVDDDSPADLLDRGDRGLVQSFGVVGQPLSPLSAHPCPLVLARAAARPATARFNHRRSGERKRQQLTAVHNERQTSPVDRARAHQRLAGLAAFALLALVAELAGRSLTERIDVGRHVPSPEYAHAGYYPFLLAFVKVGIALMLAAITWRFVKARAAARAARRLLGTVGARPQRTPRVRIQLTLESWGFTYALTAGIYLVQTDSERAAAGQWPLVSPWLHTSALPVFAVLAVLVSLVYCAVSRWLADYERYAEETAAVARSLMRALRSAVNPRARDSADPPRRLFGLAFESRPPPLPA